MKTYVIAGCVAALLAGAAVSQMQDEAPQQPEWQMPTAQDEHKWLQQLTGEWTSEIHMMNPMTGEAAGTSQGTENVRAVGDFWTIAENKGVMGDGTPFTGILTLGYDPRKEKYVGTWIDSVNDYMWTYEGTVENDTLTLTTEGPNPMDPGSTMHFKETIELKDKDHKVFTSAFRGEDGSWKKMMTIDYTRKK